MFNIFFICYHNMVTVYFGNFTVYFRKYNISRIVSSTLFYTSTNKRLLWTNTWNSLSLHVCTHQCASSIVMFQERNTGSSNRNNLIGSNVDVVQIFCSTYTRVTANTSWHKFFQEISVLVYFGSSGS